MEQTASQPARPPIIHQFTPANAREMQQRSQEARRLNKQARLNPPAIVSPITGPIADEYLNQRVTQARRQIAKLTELAAKVTDALECERLARAVAQWSEIERILCGRPLPGSKKPSDEKPAASIPAAFDPL